jgi:hypothetical protein
MTQMQHKETSRMRIIDKHFAYLHSVSRKKKPMLLSCDALSAKVGKCPCVELSAFGETT